MPSTVLTRYSLKSRITLTTLLIFVISMWSLVFYASRMLREDMVKLLGDQQLSTVSMLAAEVSREVEDRLKALETVAAEIGPMPLDNPARVQAHLAQRPVFQSLFNGGLFVTGLDGVSKAAFPAVPERIGVNYADRDFLIGALREGKTSIGKPILGKVLRAPTIGMATPIRDEQGQIIGALTGATHLGNVSFFDKIIKNTFGKTGGYLLVAPQYRLIVTASDKDRIMERLPAAGVSPTLDRFIAGYEGSDIFTNPTGVEVLASARAVPVAGWYVAAILPTSEAFAPIRDLQQRMLLAAIFLTLLAGGLSWWMLRRQLAPMLDAAKILATLPATGLPPHPLPVNGQDEISKLIQGFNHLLETLAQRDTALRRSYEEARDILDTSLDGFWRVDAQGRLRDLNPAYCRQSGYTQEELLGMHVSELEAVEHAAETVAHIERIVERGGDLFESRHRRKDGTLWDVEVSVSCRGLGEGQLFVFLRDITLRKTLERQLDDQKVLLENLVEQRTDELSAALREAKLADQTKDAFLANMSHELRTPLNAVIGMAGMARALGTDARQIDYLDKISTSGKHLNRIINDLLDLSKIAAGHIEMEDIDFSMRESLQRCLALMTDRAAEKNLELIATVDDAVPELLRGDPSRVEQIVLNLLSNAIKFTATGQVEVRIRLEAREEFGTCLAIEVEDTGIGMRPADLERLFKPFSQADATVSRKFGGTGLGLAISRQLVELMNGDIGVTSREGQGSTFRFRVWLDQCIHAANPHAGRPDSQPALPTHYRDVRVLVADDQPLNREVVEALLAAVGITLRQAEDGQQALDLLIESGPDAFDLVLMDIQMPVMDGLTATRSLRSHAGFESLPIIAMTAHTMKHEQEIAAEAGVNDHISKPFDNDDFYRTLAKWIPAGKHENAPAAPAPAATPAVPPEPVAARDAGFNPDMPRGIDFVNGLARFNGKEDRYRHWLTDFASTAGAVPGQIRGDLAAGHADAARKAAHAFKGRVGMLGMVDLHALVSALEHALRDGAPADDLLHAAEHAIEQVCEELTRFLARGNPVSAQQVLEKMVWIEAYSVGVAAMDVQHKKLIAMINQIADCQADQRVGASGDFHEILSAMFDYTQVHFTAEEAYLRKIGYPQLDTHEKEHEAFLEKAAELGVAAVEGVQNRAGLHDYLKSWLLTHILKSDMQYRHFVEEQRASGMAKAAVEVGKHSH